MESAEIEKALNQAIKDFAVAKAEVISAGKNLETARQRLSDAREKVKRAGDSVRAFLDDREPRKASKPRAARAPRAPGEDSVRARALRHLFGIAPGLISVRELGAEIHQSNLVSLGVELKRENLVERIGESASARWKITPSGIAFHNASTT
jgi:hypothetical protein